MRRSRGGPGSYGFYNIRVRGGAPERTMLSPRVCVRGANRKQKMLLRLGKGNTSLEATKPSQNANPLEDSRFQARRPWARSPKARKSSRQLAVRATSKPRISRKLEKACASSLFEAPELEKCSKKRSSRPRTGMPEATVEARSKKRSKQRVRSSSQSLARSHLLEIASSCISMHGSR